MRTTTIHINAMAAMFCLCVMFATQAFLLWQLLNRGVIPPDRAFDLAMIIIGSMTAIAAGVVWTLKLFASSGNPDVNGERRFRA